MVGGEAKGPAIDVVQACEVNAVVKDSHRAKDRPSDGVERVPRSARSRNGGHRNAGPERRKRGLSWAFRSAEFRSLFAASLFTGKLSRRALAEALTELTEDGLASATLDSYGFSLIRPQRAEKLRRK